MLVPAKNYLFIKNLDSISGKEITIIDLTGRVVIAQKYTPVIDIQNLNSGIFMLKVDDGVKDYFAQFVMVE